MRPSFIPTLLAFALSATVLSERAFGQTPRPAEPTDNTVSTGTIVSTTPHTLVVKADDGKYQLFILDRDTIKPKTLPAGSRVNVGSRPDEASEERVATAITVEPPPTVPPPPPAGQQQPPPDAVPTSVRTAEREIAKSVRRYRIGAFGGATLDPELISLEGHARLGPIFTSDVSARPAVEFAFGELTKLVAINLEGMYRLPLTPRRSAWSMYLGAGPSLKFDHRGFTAQTDNTTIEYGDWGFGVGFNFFAGVEFRNGLLLEFKSTAYDDPHVRLLIGYNF